MKSFLNNLLGIKGSDKEEIPSNESQAPTIKIEIAINQSNPADEEKTPKENKTYDINEIKKKSTIIKNKDGLLAAIQFIIEFMQNNKLDFDAKVSLYKKVIPYMKKEKSFIDEKIIASINSEFSKSESFKTTAEIYSIGDLFARVSNKEAIQYLQSELGEGESDSDKTEEYVSPIILLAELYLNESSGDEAFATIQRATDINMQTKDKFDYLFQQKKIAELASDILLKGFNKPHYELYIQQQIVVHILDIAREIIHFPNIHELFRLKKIFTSGDLEVFESENFDRALSHCNLTEYKQMIINEVNHFTFNVLPIKMGLPIEYNSPDKIDAILDQQKEDRTDWEEIGKIKNILNFQDGKELLIALEFSEAVFQKYYNMKH